MYLTLKFLFCLSCQLTSTLAASELVLKAGLFFRAVGRFQTMINLAWPWQGGHLYIQASLQVTVMDNTVSELGDGHDLKVGVRNERTGIKCSFDPEELIFKNICKILEALWSRKVCVCELASYWSFLQIISLYALLRLLHKMKFTSLVGRKNWLNGTPWQSMQRCLLWGHCRYWVSVT